MDAVMAFLHKIIAPITKLGGGKFWLAPWGNEGRGTPIYLWPFVVFAIFLALILVYDRAYADNATLTWSAPTGSEQCVADPAPPNPEFYRIYQLIGEVSASSTTFTTEPLKPGSYTFLATTVQAVTGAESRISGAAVKTVGDLVVSNTRAYTIVKTDDALQFVAAGTVPIGTVCDASQPVGGKYSLAPLITYVVPSSAVTPFSLPKLVWTAECE